MKERILTIEVNIFNEKIIVEHYWKSGISDRQTNV